MQAQTSRGPVCAVAISTGQMAAGFYFSILISHKFSACQTLLGVMILFIIEFAGKPRRHDVALLRYLGWSGPTPLQSSVLHIFKHKPY